MNPSFAAITTPTGSARLEYQWIAPERVQAPLIVFLHEGLGSLSMWKDFPQRLCDAVGCRGLVYSRPGYGQSTPRAAGEAWDIDYMHQQAHSVLPALLQALGIDPALQKLWLFGHSDGASIALLYASQFPNALTGAIVLAPHIFVEDVSIHSIQAARTTYLEADLRKRLSKHHADPDSAFWGWNTIWLDPGFRSWNIEAELASIRCPLLAVQGLDDEYGTLAQIHGIAKAAPQTQLLMLPDCGHSPYKDQAKALILATQAFIQTHSTQPAGNTGAQL